MVRRNMTNVVEIGQFKQAVMQSWVVTKAGSRELSFLWNGEFLNLYFRGIIIYVHFSKIINP